MMRFRDTVYQVYSKAYQRVHGKDAQGSQRTFRNSSMVNLLALTAIALTAPVSMATEATPEVASVTPISVAPEGALKPALLPDASQSQQSLTPFYGNALTVNASSPSKQLPQANLENPILGSNDSFQETVDFMASFNPAPAILKQHHPTVLQAATPLAPSFSLDNLGYPENQVAFFPAESAQGNKGLPDSKPTTLNKATTFEIAQAVRFSDVQGHWAQDFIEALANKRIVIGFPDGSFQPDSLITRAQYAALLRRAFQLPAVGQMIEFTDVPRSHWAYEAIQSTFAAGFFERTSDYTFGPSQGVTRLRSLTILGNGLKLKSPDNPTAVLNQYFRDGDQIPPASRSFVAAAAQNRLVVDYPDAALFKPGQLATRAEVAASVYQSLVQLGKAPALPASSLANRYIASPQTATTAAPASAANPQPPVDPAAVQARLRKYQDANNFGNIFRGSPSITINIPPAYGADDFLVFAGATYQSRTRFTQKADGAAFVGFGLFDALQTVGVEVSYTAASFGNSRTFGSGGFNVKVHHAFEGDFAIAAGWNGIIAVNDPFGDFKNSYYGVVTKIFRTSDSLDDLFSRIAVTAGVGGGQFRPLNSNSLPTDGAIGVFGSVAFRVADPVTAIVEWTGQDLALGLSLRPIQGINWTITPSVRDLAGTGLDGGRFVLGTTISVKF